MFSENKTTYILLQWGDWLAVATIEMKPIHVWFSSEIQLLITMV